MSEEKRSPCQKDRHPDYTLPSTLPPRTDACWTPARGLRNRREAARRLPPLPCRRCTGYRDPWTHRCGQGPAVEPYEGDYWRDMGFTEGLERYAPARGWGAAA